MPRFFFNTQDGETVSDADGVMLPDMVAAEVEAVRLTGELLREHAEKFWGQGATYALTVTDEDGAALFSIITAGARVPQRPPRSRGGGS